MGTTHVEIMATTDGLPDRLCGAHGGPVQADYSGVRALRCAAT